MEKKSYLRTEKINSVDVIGPTAHTHVQLGSSLSSREESSCCKGKVIINTFYLGKTASAGPWIYGVYRMFQTLWLRVSGGSQG